MEVFDEQGQCAMKCMQGRAAKECELYSEMRHKNESFGCVMCEHVEIPELELSGRTISLKGNEKIRRYNSLVYELTGNRRSEK